MLFKGKFVNDLDFAYLTLDDPQIRQMAVQDPEGLLDALGKRALAEEGRRLSADADLLTLDTFLARVIAKS